MASMAERSAVVHPPISGWSDQIPYDFAIRKDGTFVVATSRECTALQSGPNGIPLPEELSRLTLPKEPGFRDGPKEKAHFFSPVGVSILPDGMSVAVVDAGNECVRFVSWPSNSVTTHSGVGVQKPSIGDSVKATFEGKTYIAKVTGQTEEGYYDLKFRDGSSGHGFNLVQNGLKPHPKKDDGRVVFDVPQRIAAWPDGSYLVTAGGKVWNVTSNGSARPYRVSTDWVAPVAALPNGSAVLCIHDQVMKGHIVELEQDGTLHNIALVVDGSSMAPNYNACLSDARFSRIVGLAVDIQGRIVVLDEMEVSEAELIAAGVPKNEADRYAIDYTSVRVIDRTVGTVRTLELVDQKGSPIRNIKQIEGRDIDMKATLPHGGRIAIDGIGNIVFASKKGFQLITNTGLAPGLTAYNGHDQRRMHELEKENERLHSQLKYSRPIDFVDMVGDDEIIA